MSEGSLVVIVPIKLTAEKADVGEEWWELGDGRWVVVSQYCSKEKGKIQETASYLPFLPLFSPGIVSRRLPARFPGLDVREQDFLALQGK